jgi:L-ascorbate metabolism protein UlaG (beta-lactamase superfamily)
MDLRLLRHATLLIDLGGHCLLVDPMLDAAGVRPPVQGTANDLPNPLIDLPADTIQSIGRAEAILVTHLHADHLDEGAVELLPKGLPVACQPEDEEALRAKGFRDVRPVDGAIDLDGVSVARTPARHGRGEIGEQMAPASGFVLRVPGDRELYVAGDSIWSDEVDEAIAEHSPEVIVVNAGAAQFLEGGPITMDADDVVATARAANGAPVVAVHMEAVNHCLLTRDELRDVLEVEGVAGQVYVPSDGETLRF